MRLLIWGNETADLGKCALALLGSVGLALTLIREHDTLRELAAAVEQAMRGHDAVGAMSAMHRLLQASDLHARHEEEVLHRLAVRGARPPGERAAARGASREL